MMKKTALVLACICVFAGISSAQEFTNTRILKQASVGFKISGDENYAKALSMARAKGWALSFTSREGRVAVLTGVDDFGHPKYVTTNNNTIAAATTRANQLWPGGSSGLNLSGSSANMKNKLGIWDGGSVLATHQELTGRVTQKDNPSATSDHSTHVAGTMMASGVNPSAKGMAFGVQGIVAYDFNSDLTEIASEAPNLVVSNHSYSIISGWNYNSSQSRWEFNGRSTDNEDYKFGYYSSDAQALDSIAYNAPFYLIVKSAGNTRTETGPAVGQPYFRYNSSGQMASAGNRPAGISSNDSYDGISWDCGAKNILTIGAVSGLPGGYSRKEDVLMSDFSSWGPTDDGRIKPDVVADGVNVLSPINTSNTAYASYSGTSMASPNAAGSLFLLQEYYSKLKGATSFLRSATLKGLAIHTADEAGTSPGPDYQYGWGLLNVLKASEFITNFAAKNNDTTSPTLMYENSLAQGATFTKTVIATGKGPLSATISWTDVKGNVDLQNVLNNRTKNLVNDLDIRVTRGSKTFFPWTLDVNNPSFAAAPGDNSTDNVERIDVDSTIPGQIYTITVTHKGTLARGSQAYSLLVSGVGGVAYCTSASGGGGARIDSVNFKTIHVLNSAGAKTYTNNTNYVADIEASQTIPISIRTSTSDASTNPRIVKVFIDFNNNGTFETSELVATSGVLASTSTVFNANITTPANLTVGNICLMRIIVQETSTATDIAACGTYGKGETQDYRVRVVNPSNDVSISGIVSPSTADCGTSAQYVTVTLKNNGSVDQSNIPITASIATGSTVVANLAFTFPGPLSAGSTFNYTFQTPITTSGGTAYTLTAATALTADQNAANNTLVSTFLTPSKPAAVSAAGNICGTTVTLKVVSPDASNYYWYSTATATSPFAVGSTVTTTTIPTDKTYYVAKEAKVSVGAANKAAFTAGGYNMFVYNYVKINNTVPVVLETARMYIGYPGKIRFTLANLISESSSSFNYQPLASTTVDVYPTTPTPTSGAVTGNNATDTGAIFNLNLPVSTVGDHIIIIECLDKKGVLDTVTNLGATIFRNNGITGTTYPIGIPNIMSITGNSAHNTTGASDNQFYYFFYDMKVNTGACVSDRVAIVATTAPVPVITQSADSLVSSISSGNQWYLNDTTVLSGSTGKSFKPTKSGKYKVIVTDAFGCQQTSNTISFVPTAINNVSATEIKLNVFPNPNRGSFNLSFEVTDKADLSIDILSETGQKVYNSTYPNFTGKFSKQITLDGLSSEFYILQIQHNKKNYVQKILIQR